MLAVVAAAVAVAFWPVSLGVVSLAASAAGVSSASTVVLLVATVPSVWLVSQTIWLLSCRGVDDVCKRRLRSAALAAAHAGLARRLAGGADAHGSFKALRAASRPLDRTTRRVTRREARRLVSEVDVCVAEAVSASLVAPAAVVSWRPGLVPAVEHPDVFADLSEIVACRSDQLDQLTAAAVVDEACGRRLVDTATALRLRQVATASRFVAIRELDESSHAFESLAGVRSERAVALTQARAELDG
jgi:hypothetical protein